MAGRSAGGGSRGGGGRSMGGSRGMGGGFSGGSRSSRGGLGGGSRGSSGGFSGSSRGASGRSMGSRSGSGRSLSSAGPNRKTSSGGNNTSGNPGGYGGGHYGGMHHGGLHGRGHFHGWHYPRPSFGFFRPRYRRNSFGCLSSFIYIPLMLFFIFIISTSMRSNNSNSNQNSNTNITSNTVKREPLEKGAVVETSYYEDNLNWINNKTTLQKGLKNFYNLTGIQPFILLVKSIGNDPTDAEIDAYANQYYDEHFVDEAHLLFIYIEDIDYMYGIVGSRGKAIMDQEAWDILYDYAENYWHSDLEDEDMFATVFTKAGERIMSDPNAGTKMKTGVLKVLIIVIAIIIIISILRKWQKDRALQKQKEDENLKDILNTPLETFGSQEMDDLMEKYKKDDE